MAGKWSDALTKGRTITDRGISFQMVDSDYLIKDIFIRSVNNIHISSPGHFRGDCSGDFAAKMHK